MKTRRNPKKADPKRAEWQRPIVKKLDTGYAEAGPTFATDGGSAS